MILAMGVLKGTITVRKYRVLDAIPESYNVRFLRGIRAHAFMPLDPKSEVDTASGWVSLDDPEDADFAPEKIFYDGQVRIALRVDKLKPPAPVVARELKKRIAQMEAEEGRVLARRERRLLKEEVVRGLRHRAFPSVKVVDVVWFTEDQRIYFWSTTKGMNEAFVDLFVKSFGLKLDREGPGTLVAGLSNIKQLEPSRELWLGFEGVRPLQSNTTDDDEGDEGEEDDDE